MVRKMILRYHTYSRWTYSINTNKEFVHLETNRCPWYAVHWLGTGFCTSGTYTTCTHYLSTKECVRTTLTFFWLRARIPDPVIEPQWLSSSCDNNNLFVRHVSSKTLYFKGKKGWKHCWKSWRKVALRCARIFHKNLLAVLASGGSAKLSHV